MRAKAIKYFGKPYILICDGLCGKAFGSNSRLKNQLSDDENNWEYLSDNELFEAPVDPGTYEHNDAKPIKDEDKLNRWCARECERSKMVEGLEYFELPDFSKRVRNIKLPDKCIIYSKKWVLTDAQKIYIGYLEDTINPEFIVNRRTGKSFALCYKMVQKGLENLGEDILVFDHYPSKEAVSHNLNLIEYIFKTGYLRVTDDFELPLSDAFSLNIHKLSKYSNDLFLNIQKKLEIKTI